MKKGVLLGLPLVMIAPLMLLILGMGSANIEAVQAACSTAVNSTTGGSVGIGTLNWRGASHYNTNPHPGERPYDERVPNMVAKINSSGASIIGFQEFEPQQAQAFLNATNGAWSIVKGKNGRGNASTANAIAYQLRVETRRDPLRRHQVRRPDDPGAASEVHLHDRPRVDLGAQHPQPGGRGRRYGRDARCRSSR